MKNEQYQRRDLKNWLECEPAKAIVNAAKLENRTHISERELKWLDKKGAKQSRATQPIDHMAYQRITPKTKKISWWKQTETIPKWLCYIMCLSLGSTVARFIVIPIIDAVSQ